MPLTDAEQKLIHTIAGLAGSTPDAAQEFIKQARAAVMPPDQRTPKPPTEQRRFPEARRFILARHGRA